MSVLPSFEEIEKAAIEKKEQVLLHLWMERYSRDWIVTWGKNDAYFGRKDVGITFNSSTTYMAVVHVKLNYYKIRFYDYPSNWVDTKSAKHPDLALDAVCRWILQGVI